MKYYISLLVFSLISKVSSAQSEATTVLPINETSGSGSLLMCALIGVICFLLGFGVCTYLGHIYAEEDTEHIY